MLGGHYFKMKSCRFQAIFVLAMLVLAAGFAACKKEVNERAKQEENEREIRAIMLEMSGDYDAQLEQTQINVDGERPPQHKNFQLKITELGSFYSPSGSVINVDLQLGKITEESVFLNLSQVQHRPIDAGGKEVGTRYYIPEPKFSGYVGVYDRKAKTLQLSLRTKEVYTFDKVERDYRVLYTGKRK